MTTYLRNGIIALVFVSLLALFGAIAPAHTKTANAEETDVNMMLSQINTLLEQIKKLQQQLAELKGDVRDALKSDLREGMTDEDIRKIQKLLASDPEIYPEGIATGYFGQLTQQALMRLQRCHGLLENGEIDEDTRELLEAFISSKNVGEARKLCRIANASTDLDERIEKARDVMRIGIGSPRTTVRICHNNNSIAVGKPAARAHLAHGDTLGACDDPKKDNDESDDKESDDNENDEADDTEEEEEDSDEESAETAIDEAKAAIEEAEDAIDDTSSDDTSEAESLLEEAEDKLDEAEDAFDDEDWEDAESLAEEAEDLAKDAEDAVEDDEDDDDNATSTDDGTNN